jgi:predicted O-methyltransferase YrrM
VPIVSPDIERYLGVVSPASSGVLREMETLAEKRGFPIVGPLVGRLLHLLTRGIGARTVFECGSGFGYSAAWFARALPPGGRVVLTDGAAANCEAAREFLGRAGLLERVEIRQGEALEQLGRETGPFDVVFCDIDKRDYPRVHPLLGPRLRPGGLFLCDNMLWQGKVAGPDRDPDTEGVRELTRRLYADPGLETVILPLRDGVAVSLRI